MTMIENTGSLQINAEETQTPFIITVNIHAKDIEIVDTYKYLGVHLDNKLDWSDNTNRIYKKGESGPFLLR